MAFIPTPGAVRVDIKFDYGGQECHNVIWCGRDTEWTQTQREDLAEAIETWWSSSGKPGSTAGYTLQQITVTNQDADNAPSTTRVVSPAIPGTGGSAGMPGNVALCATLRTENRGRSYRGRFYWGGQDESKQLTANTATAAHIANIIAFLNNLNAAIAALGAIWVIVSKYHNKIARATGVKTPVTAISVNDVYDSQRRRLPGRGV